MKFYTIPACLVFLALVFIFTQVPISVKCDQCDGHVHNETLAERIATKFEMRFLHDYCAKQFLADRPLQRDENGKVISPW